MDAGNGEDRDPHSGSEELPRNPIGPQRVGSIGEEAASNIVGGGSGPSGTGLLGSTGTPTDSTHAAANSGLSGSKRSRRHSWVWNHFSINENFKNENGVDIGARAVCHYCDTYYKCKSNNGVGPHGRHLRSKHADKIGDASDSSNFVYSKEKMRHGLALYVAAAEQPFTFVSRNSTRNDTKKAYSEVKKDLISELATVGAIGFTSDMWSGINNRGYICVTAHYIDSSWTLQKKIIAFRLVEFPHDAEQIYESIMGVFRDFEVVDRVYSITFDNHSANSATLPLQQEFDKLCTSLYSLKPKNMNSDVQNRWNSTYLMLKSCQKYSDAISAYVNQRYRPCRGNPLTIADWEIGFEFMKFLKVFYAATVACSGVRYPTSCIVLHHLFNISVNFRKHREHPNFAHACIDMEGKFRKYYEEMPPIFMLAAIMDPRMKLQGVSLLLREIGTNLGITALPSSANVNDLLNIMYAKYESKFRSNASCTTAPLTSSTSTNDEFWDFVSSNLGIGSSTGTSRIELEKYLDLESINVNDRRDFDVLAWWKKNEDKYPVLSIMARDLLTPPVSTVASESAFSAGKRVLDERRSRLAPDILDCLICLKDWEDARLGIQKRSAKDEFRGYFADSDIDISGLKWILWQLMKALNGNMMLPPLQFLAMIGVATYEGHNGNLTLHPFQFSAMMIKGTNI
ncbi:zinc finger BED domain-containing protein RICESLEEPER 2-like [Rhododendron vialii]|uniref:zinc finger BED domain-containing protein RICESLEEPER 2-like n=1 Tax=Rhododendron vialii TaxID=182163 RepID=UPI00265DB3D4|nr:zinc finger BED domain-containing protein RICESLEEPER 2-like [Rhododendron vialii]